MLHLSASFTSIDDKAHGLDAGADGYLVRPVEPVELLATVNALLRTRRAEDALRQSEERYREIAERLGLALDSAELGTFFCPMPLGKIEWNVTCKHHFWLPPNAEIDFDVFYSIVHPDDRQRVSIAVDSAVTSHQPYDVEYRTVAPDGRTRWIRAKGKAYYDASGNPLRFDGITIDISRQKQIEAEREQALAAERIARAEAERANQLKDEFLATLSHELRTPLNAIIGWSQILRAAPPAEADLDEGLATIERNASIQAQLIEDLLDVSRIISGKLRLEVQTIDLGPVIVSAQAAVQPAADAKRIRIVRSITGVEAIVRADAGRVQQIVWNLLSNAIKFTPAGGTVEVSLEHVEGHVQIQVSDSGRGISPAFLPYVFDRFRQADPSSTRQHGGLGLGLAIVKQLAELHGGSVDACSDGEGRGATFVVLLPVAPPVVAEPLPKKQVASEARSKPLSWTPNDLQGDRILIVEDDDDSRRLLGHVLRARGATVTMAGSVDDAMEQWTQGTFDLLISDIGMPGRDGYDLIREIRATPGEAGKIPAIALTAFARIEDRAAALEAGFDQHLSKPAEPAALVAAITAMRRN